MVLTENTVVADRFRLSRMIGKGGMGSVWQATDLRLSTTCAVKFIEGELANMAEAHARFQREAQAAAQLRSPHVVQIFDHGVWEGHPYIAMELLDGEDLGKRITTQGGRLPAGVVNAVVQQVCRALAKAHVAGVVHRDLKPDNIFLVNDDDREIVKILDFGVAKSAGQALDGSNTKTGAMLGTPYYMSPEQAQGIKSVDSRSDLWSLAVIVFQCLTGRLPFESEALGDLLVKIIVAPIPNPSVYNDALPASVDAWWAKAADRNPENRFQTAKAFAESLGLALGQSSVTDVQDRARLMRQVGGTAIMNHGSQPEIFAHVPNTPMPGAHTAAMTTPNPMQGSGAPYFQPMQGGPPGGPMMQTPHQMQAPMHGTTGNPVAATYSGLDPAGLPKKSLPIALFVGLGLLALVGLGLGGIAVMKGKSVSVDPASASAATALVSAAPEPPASAPVETVPAADPPAIVAAKEATSAVASASAAPSAALAVAPAGAPRGGVAPVRTASGSTAKPNAGATGATTAVAAPATTKGKEKPINLGF